MNIYNQLRDTEFREPGEQFVISLDEFQHARTIKENGREEVKPKERILWQLLDDGTFEMHHNSISRYQEMSAIANVLKEAIKQGVVANNGRIEQHADTFRALV